MKSILLLPVLCCLSTTLGAQQVIETIDFLQFKQNPNNLLLKTSCQAKYGKTYVIKIDNINRAVYKVEESTSQQDFNTDLPSAFASFRLPAFLNYDPPRRVGPSVEKEPLESLDKEKDIETALQAIKRANKAFERAIRLENTLKNLAVSCDLSYLDIRKRADDAIREVLDDQELNNPCGLPGVGLRAYLENQIACAESSAARLKADWQEYKSKAPAARKEALEPIIAQATASVGEMLKFRNENRIQQLLNRDAAINPGNYTYYTNWFVADKDMSTLELKFSNASTEPSPCYSRNQYRLKRNYRTQGGLKVDFSGGVFINGGSQDFLGRELQYVPVSDSTVQITAKDGGGRLLLSVGGLMHLYKRTCDNTHVAVSAGVSLTPDLQSVNLHAGLSLILGRKNRIAITLGPVLKQSTVLDKRYDYDTTYLKKNLPDAPPTAKTFPVVGAFLAMTYNWERLDK